jgi:Zn-finger nucleic acid-binding protein
MDWKASEQEEQYFKQQELDMKKKFEEEREAYLAAQEKENIAKLHFMKCPKCYNDLKEENYKEEINIDRCRECGGVWLDAGELDVLVESEKGYRQEPTAASLITHDIILSSHQSGADCRLHACRIGHRAHAPTASLANSHDCMVVGYCFTPLRRGSALLAVGWQENAPGCRQQGKDSAV